MQLEICDRGMLLEDGKIAAVSKAMLFIPFFLAPHKSEAYISSNNYLL